MTTKTLMAVGAHADDIEFNAGGTLSKYRDAGYEVVYVMSTNNMSGSWTTVDADGQKHSRMPAYDEIMPQRKKEAAEAARYYGTEAIHLDHPQRHYTRKDGGVEDLRYGGKRPDCVRPDEPTIITAYEDKASVQRLADLIVERNPEAVFGHGMVTGNVEHTSSCLLVSNAFWQAQKRGARGMLLYWEDVHQAPVGEAYSRWDTYIDVSNYWDKKLAALAIHACQVSHIMKTLEIPFHAEETGCSHAEIYHLACAGDRSNGAFSEEILNHRR